MISMDKKYRTRDGRDVRLLCVDGPEKYPVIGAVDGEETPDCWTSDGWYTGSSGSSSDLIEYHEPDIRTIWVNVYEDSIDPYDTEDDAKHYLSDIRIPITIAQPVTFEVKK